DLDEPEAVDREKLFAAEIDLPGAAGGGIDGAVFVRGLLTAQERRENFRMPAGDGLRRFSLHVLAHGEVEVREREIGKIPAQDGRLFRRSQEGPQAEV